MSPVKTGRILDLQRYTLALRTRDVRGWLQACQTTCQAIFSVALPPSRRVSEKDPGKDVPPPVTCLTGSGRHSVPRRQGGQCSQPRRALVVAVSAVGPSEDS